MNEEPFYVVNQKLASYPITHIFRNREKLWLDPDNTPALDNSSANDNATPIPVSPDGQLVPGTLYPSSVDPSVRYYLPQYQLHSENGHYTTRLKFRGAQDDPNGPLAWLTIDLEGILPASQNVTLREIDHEAVVRLGYQMTISNSAQPDLPAPAQDGSHIDDFVGNWVNTNAATSNMTRLQVAKVNANALTFHGFGKCHPSDCDWGVISVPFTPGKTIGTYNFSLKRRKSQFNAQGIH